MYYDSFEMDCGCRMHCTCPKVGICDYCGEYGGLHHISQFHFACIVGCKPKAKPKVRREGDRWVEVAS